MKKLLITLLIVCLIFMTGCSDISQRNVNDIMGSILFLDNNLNNTYMEGYSFYLPHDVKLTDKSDFNLILEDSDSVYYLYLDIVGYHYKTKNAFVNTNDYISQKIDYNGKEGYINVKENNDKYYVIIEYNYAKIESVVKKDNLKKSLITICSLLSSIKYNDTVIDGFIGDASYKFQEEKFSIFKKENNNDNFLKYEDEFGTYKDDIVISNNDDVIDIDEVIE